MTGVLLITNIFPPQIGGPATFIERTAEALAQRGETVTVVCSSDVHRDARDVARRYRVIRVRTDSPYRYQLEMRRMIATQMLKHRRILVNGLEPFVVPVSRLLRRSYILKVVGDSAWEYARNSGQTALDIDSFQRDRSAQQRFASVISQRNRAVSAAEIVVTPSHYLKGLVEDWGACSGDVVVIPNGVRQPTDNEPRVGANRTDTGPLQLLFVGRVTNWKGVETVLLALTQVTRRGAFGRRRRPASHGCHRSR